MLKELILLYWINITFQFYCDDIDSFVVFTLSSFSTAYLNVYDHTTLKALVLIWSLKLSSVGQS